MNILIIGSGGREYAVCKKLTQSNCTLFYYSKTENYDMSKIAKLLDLGETTNCNKICELAKQYNINIVFIGSESVLASGLSDELAKINIPCIGPTKELAKIETSKIFARQLMLDNNMAQYCPKILYTLECGKVCDYTNIQKLIANYEIVVKPDGLHSGKGVKVQGDHFATHDQGIKHCYSILGNKENVIIEEKLVGEEFSLMSFCDGKTLKHMIPVKDYKRVFEDDKGPNCGSMGCVSNCLWFLDDKDLKVCHTINEIVIQILQKMTGSLYKGIIYGSFMKTKNKEIKVIEFNARFGDPECINILHSLDTDLLDIFKAIVNGTLDQIDLKFRKKPTVFKYLVPNGYPNKPVKTEINIPKIDQNMIFANVEYKDNKYYTLESRALGYVFSHDDINFAANYVNDVLSRCTGNLFYRKDIGLNMSLSYKKSGVDVAEKNKAVNEIEQLVRSTYTDEVLSKFGDFNGIIDVNDNKIVTSTDGVGTKSIIVLEHYGYEVGLELLGSDLVNLNINDILVSGASPLFFLDYFGCGKLNKDHLKYFIKGIVKACRAHNCVLLKGETAIMPDIYQEGKYDLVGTVVGQIYDEINSKENIKEGNIVLGLKSFGFQTNGFTLIRKILERLKDYCDIDSDVMDSICAPHKSFSNDILTLQRYDVQINGLCHITGGGLIENPPRVLPDNLQIDFDFTYPDIFKFIKEKGVLSDYEMMETFNCGYGFLVIVPENSDLDGINIQYDVIGKIVKK